MIVKGTDPSHVIQFVVDKWTNLKLVRTEKENKWIACMRAYLCAFDDDWQDASKEANRSSRYYSATYDAVETLHSQLMSMILPDDRWMYVEPAMYGRAEYDDDAAEEAFHLLRQQQHECLYHQKISEAMKWLIITGNCPYTVGWRIEKAVNYPAYQAAMAEWEEKNKAEFAEYHKTVAAMEVMRVEAERAGQPPPPPPADFRVPEPPAVSRDIAYEGPTIEIGDPFNFVIDPFSPDPKHALRIRRIWVSKETLKQMTEKDDEGYSVYEDTDGLSEANRETAADDYLALQYRSFGLNVPINSGVELLEASGTMEIPNGAADGRSVYVSFIATVANRVRLIRFEPTFLYSGELPTQLATYNTVPGQVYGWGPIEPNLGLANLINVRVNQAVDIIAALVNPEYKMVADGVTDPRAKSAPGRRHLVGQLDNLVPLDKDFRGVQFSMAEVDNLVREYRSMTRAITPMGGSTSESATKTALDANVVGTELGKIAQHIELVLIEASLNLFVQMDSQFMSKTRVAKKLQDGKIEITEISPESIRGWAIRAKGSKHFADRQEQIINLAQFIGQHSMNQLTVPALNLLELMKKQYRLLGFHDEDKVFNDADRAQDILDQMISAGMLGGNPNVGQESASGSDGPAAAASPSSGSSPAGPGASGGASTSG